MVDLPPVFFRARSWSVWCAWCRWAAGWTRWPAASTRHRHTPRRSEDILTVWCGWLRPELTSTGRSVLLTQQRELNIFQSGETSEWILLIYYKFNRAVSDFGEILFVVDVLTALTWPRTCSLEYVRQTHWPRGQNPWVVASDASTSLNVSGRDVYKLHSAKKKTDFFSTTAHTELTASGRWIKMAYWPFKSRWLTRA